MSLSEYQKERCLKVMDTIQSRQISRMFLNPVNPVADSCPDYFIKIKHPMDLTTCRQKLENGQYENVEQWKNDMELIWNNALTYNGPSALISLLAKELQIFFKELTSNISSDLTSDWNSQFEKLKLELNQAIKSIPKVPQPKPKRSVRSGSSITPNNITNQEAQSIQRPSSLGASKASSKTIPLQTENEKDESFSNNLTTSTAVTPLSPEEIKLLSSELAMIDNPVITKQIIDLVKRLEPQTASKSDDGNFILEVNKMKDSTLVELRNMVSQILGH